MMKRQMGIRLSHLEGCGRSTEQYRKKYERVASIRFLRGFKPSCKSIVPTDDAEPRYV